MVWKNRSVFSNYNRNLYHCKHCGEWRKPEECYRDSRDRFRCLHCGYFVGITPKRGKPNYKRMCPECNCNTYAIRTTVYDDEKDSYRRCINLSNYRYCVGCEDIIKWNVQTVQSK